VTEHFMFHGLFLALLRPGRRWPVVPEPAPVEGPAWHRALRWSGLAQPAHGNTRLQRSMRWLGVPEGCLGAMVLQAVLFGVGHVGKAPAELILSFPGGLGLAYVAYRCNSFLVPMILHLATGLTALGFISLF
jgi:membrane protease YdiL (CAAX protease family)